MTKETAKLYTISLEEAYFQYCVAYVSKAWAHLKNFNRVIALIQQSGLPQIWEYEIGAKYMDNSVQNTLRFARKFYSAAGDEPVPFGMSNFSGMLVIWVIGVGLSAFVFFVEIRIGRTH